MAETADDIKSRIEKLMKDEFRYNLFARGQAKSLIGRNSTSSSEDSDHEARLGTDLIFYAYTLLDFGLCLRDLDNTASEAHIAFARAAEVFDAAITREPSDSDDLRFDLLMAASCYHLARKSACAYSMLLNVGDRDDISVMEHALTKLILRDIPGLQNMILGYRVKGEGSDINVSRTLEKHISSEGEAHDKKYIDEDAIVKCIIYSLNDSFCSAMSTVVMAIERGSVDLIDDSIDILNVGIKTCSEWKLVHQWWFFRISIHLILDIWNCTLHTLLPVNTDTGSVYGWNQIRKNFISVLYKKKRSEIELWPSQVKAAKSVINEEENLTIFMPTSSGKTRIAELGLLKCISTGRRAVFVTPLRALSAQTEATLRKTFSPLGINVSTFYSGIDFGEFDKDEISMHDIVVSTPEKLDYALRHDKAILDDIGLVVFDEGHMIGTGVREVRYEVQIQRLLRRSDAASRRIIVLSAVLPDEDSSRGFASWIGGKPCDPVTSEWKPTRTRFAELSWKSPFGHLTYYLDNESPCVEKFIEKSKVRNFPKNRHELCLAAAWNIAEGGQAALIYCPEKRGLLSYVDKIIDLYECGVLRNLLKVEDSKIESAVTVGEEWLGQGNRLIECLKLGVGLHHGSLPVAYRRELEKLMHDNVLSVIISTSTLSQGLNLSVKSIIMHTLTRSGKAIESSEFRNVIGRAGRAYIDTEGDIIFPIFRKDDDAKARWLNLVHNHKRYVMLSGIGLLVMELALRMSTLFQSNNIDRICNRLISESGIWDDLNNRNNSRRDKYIAKIWKENLEKLDFAILSLAGDSENPEDDVYSVLKKALHNSLLESSITQIDNILQSKVDDLIVSDDSESIADDIGESTRLEKILMSRGVYIWQRSDADQRRRYFLSGVGFAAGREIDSAYGKASEVLKGANQKLSDGDIDSTVVYITEFARIMFNVSTFRCDKLPGEWKEILDCWIRGDSLSKLEIDDKVDIFDFIENGIRYNLNWAMNVIIDRIAMDADIKKDDEELIQKSSFRHLMMTIMAGTPNISAAVLIQSGFSFRSAAMVAVSDPDANFDNQADLSTWLDSESIRQKSAISDWPTPETNHIWNEFVTRFRTKSDDAWERKDWIGKVQWEESAPASGMLVQIFNYNDETLILSDRGERLGKLLHPVNPDREGIIDARVSEASEGIDIRYFGPDDLWDRNKIRNVY